MIGVAVALFGGLIWIGLRGDAHVSTFFVGAAVSLLAAWITRLGLRGGPALGRLGKGLLICFQILVRFVIDAAIANARQLKLVLSPRIRARSRWIRFTTRLERPATRLALGVLISLTPGTVTEELRGDEYVIHVLDADPDEDPLVDIRSRIEAPLLRLEEL